MKKLPKRGKNKQLRGDSSYSLLNRASMSKHVGFPERYRTTVATEISCYLAASTATAAYGNYFSVCINALVQAFSVSTYTPTTGSGTYLYGFSGALVQGNSISGSPMWYNELASIYTAYKVLRYRLKVSVRSTSSADVFEIVLLPLGTEQIPSASQSNVNTRVLLAQPRSVHKVCSNGGNAQKDSVQLSQTVANLLNIRQGAWLDYPPTPMTQVPGTIGGQGISGYVGFFLQMLNGVANTGSISVDIELEQEVEFTDINQPLS